MKTPSTDPIARRHTTQGGVIWITGVPSCGKTTLASLLLERLAEREVSTLWLDSDDLRRVWHAHGTFSDEERDAFYAAIGHLALLGAAGGVTVVVSATGNRRAYRDKVREMATRFVEVWLRCPPETLRERDDKGLYARADRGELTGLPGLDAPYEAPREPDVIFDTDADTPDKRTHLLLRYLDTHMPTLSND